MSPGTPNKPKTEALVHQKNVETNPGAPKSLGNSATGSNLDCVLACLCEARMRKKDLDEEEGRCYCMKRVDFESLSNVKLISHLSVSDRCEIQLHI